MIFHIILIENNFSSDFVVVVDEDFAEIFVVQFTKRKCFQRFLHFSSSENVEEEINEDSQHVSCLSVT